MSPSQDQTQNESTTGQGTEVAVVPCPNCGADVAQTGFLVATVTYQGYARSGGKIVKSYKAKSSIHTVHCVLCRATLSIKAEDLT